MLNSWFKTIFTTGALIIIGFAGSIISARWLGPDGRGLLASALLIMSLSYGVGQLGLGAAFVYACRLDPNFSRRTFFLTSLVSTTSLAVLLAALAFESGDVPSVLFLPLLLLTGSSAANAFASAVVQLAPGLVAFNLGRVGVPATTLLMFILMAYFDFFTVANVLWAQAVATLAVAVFLSFAALSLMRIPSESTTSHRPMTGLTYLVHGLKVHGTTLLGLLLLNVDKLTFYLLASAKEFGLYSVAFATSRLMGGAQEAISTALYARFAGKDPDKLAEITQLSFRLSFLPMLAVALLLGSTSPWLLRSVYGEAFVEISVPFAILAVECVIGNASWILAQQFHASGRPGIVLIRQAIAVVPVLFLVLWIPRDHLALSLSLILLLSAVLRLIITMLMFKWACNKPIPSIIPTGADIRAIIGQINKLRTPQIY